jgi:tRNA(Leu) C34 or U34 (ribose-2'-O)-methylase TrmL
MGMKLAQVSLSYGVDDIDGTIIEEKIYHMAGAETPQEAGREELVKTIREAGREPVQRDSLYRAVARKDEGGGMRDEERPRFYYVTTKSKRPYTEPRYRWGDYLVFGRETAGLPKELLEANADTTITIPMFNPDARSLNLATAVAIVLYEAMRQVKGF